MATRPRDLACPSCQEKFRFNEVLFQCSDPRCELKTQPPPGLRADLVGQPVFRPARYKFNVTCPYGHPASFKLCPRCWDALPVNVGNTSTIALVGSSNAGKTCFVAALIQQIKRRLSRPDACRMSLEWDDEAGREFFRQLQREIFQENQIPSLTQKLRTIQVTIRFDVQRFWTRLRQGAHGVVSLVFPDQSGEDFQSMGRETYALNYIAHAPALILLVDPLGSEDYCKRHGLPVSEFTYSTADSLRTVVSGVRRELGQPVGPLPKQLAVVLAKCDEKGLFDPDAAVWGGRFPPQGRRYDPRLAEEIHLRVEEHLDQELGMSEVLALAKQNFRHVRCFATSALGAPPIRSTIDGQTVIRLNNPTPRRVEEPLLWILHAWGYL